MSAETQQGQGPQHPQKDHSGAGGKRRSTEELVFLGHTDVIVMSLDTWGVRNSCRNSRCTLRNVFKAALNGTTPG
jgi:hypothetical protein